jgi:hypothetical protein
MFSREDKANRNTYMKAVREEAVLIHDRLTAVQELMKDDNYLDISYSCDKTPVSISEESINQIKCKLMFILSDNWEKEYNEIFDALDESKIEYRIDSDEEELIRFTIILIHDEYHLLVDIGIRDDHLDIMDYYINTEEDINDIPNTLPLERKDCGSWRDIVSIWISELKRIADEGWELFS